MVYLCEATFVGEGSLAYASPPETGRAHKCMPLIRQSENKVDSKLATETLHRYGWLSVIIRSAAPIKVEALNDPNMHVFQKHYE